MTKARQLRADLVINRGPSVHIVEASIIVHNLFVYIIV